MDEVTIQLRTPRSGVAFLVLAPLGAAACVAWIIAAPSFASIGAGGLVVASVVALTVQFAAVRRAAGSLSPTIRGTGDGLETALWQIAWRDVDCLSIGYVQRSAKLRALFVHPRTKTSVHYARAIQLQARLNQWLSHAPIRILQVNVDRPLEDIATDFERLAGRPLLAR